MNYKGSQKGFSQLLNSWGKRSTENADLITSSIAMHESDLYKLPEDEISGHFLHHALEVLEAEMPYITGFKVIRIEEGDEIYEDIGPLPRYLKAQKKLRKDMNS